MPEKHKFSGTNQKPERRRPFGTGLVRQCPQGLFSPFFTFLGAIYFPARLDFSSSPLSAPGPPRMRARKTWLRNAWTFFSGIGANSSEFDVDTAYREPTRNQNCRGRATGRPVPVVCKFTRRIARDVVLAKRRETGDYCPRALISRRIVSSESRFTPI